ncbi:TL1 [Symbiodinium sp. KB8]|nr:TL1 [Symbiodinium sp. KB8]|eukprot:CAMPEP_0181449152 /NCGR_PEP_ID=MMETSP1110-20121109/27510_1 /TAXON_ID=174948 /ORGANISM="Symbiodinium sp., Strain CCMP421" /LENGTH=370 /DNA_ID=CAMNT_0023573327 /DNA_START=82 /DNA_END=1194 /DNA_ORIENTATION=+
MAWPHRQGRVMALLATLSVVWADPELQALNVDDACNSDQSEGSCDLTLTQLRGLPRRASEDDNSSEVMAEVSSGRSQVSRRLRIVNGCNSQPMWIAHIAGASMGPDPQNVRINPGSFYDFETPSHLSAMRYWPKMGCDESGHNCKIGSSGGPGQSCQWNPATGQEDYSRCHPPVDTKFEASYGENGAPCNPKTPGGVEMKGCDYVDLSLVDGWTLPVKFEASGDCRTNKDEKVEVLDCAALSLDACPTAEHLTAAGVTADLRAINPVTHQVSGCYSPCAKLLDTKWSNKELAQGRQPESAEVSPYCCPTPPQTPESCRAGPITHTDFLKTVHQKCPGVYGYAYDDGTGLMRCSSATHYTVTFFCPAALPA